MRLAVVLVAAAALLACWPALEGDFVYDDTYYVVRNPAVTGEASPWTSPLGTPAQALWRPLTVLSWRLQWPDGARIADATPLRAVNLALHVGVALLVLALGRALGFAAPVAGVAALLFAIHPVHAEAVAWVTGRAELLAAACVLAGWLAWLSPRRGAALACGLAVLAGGLCKEHALLAPVLYLGFDLLARPREARARRPALVLALAGAAAVVAARAAVLPSVLPTEAPYAGLPLGERAIVATNVLARSLALLAWPHPLRVFYHRSELVAATPAALGVLLVAAALASLLWRRDRRAAAALLLVPVSLATVLNLVPIGETFAERFLYLPSALGCLALAGLLGVRLRAEQARGDGPGASLVALVLVVLAAVPAARAASATFADDLTLWSHAAEVTPGLAHARYNHGYFLMERGRTLALDVDRPGGPDELRASLALAPRHRYAAFAHDMLGQHVLERVPPSPVLAAHHFREAIEHMPELPAPRIHLAGLATADPALVLPAEARALLEPLLEGGVALPREDRQLVESLLAELGSADG